MSILFQGLVQVRVQESPLGIRATKNFFFWVNEVEDKPSFSAKKEHELQTLSQKIPNSF